MNRKGLKMTLKELRKNKNLTLEKLSKKVGLSFQALSLYEQGLRKPKIETIKKLADALEVSVEEIINCF